MFAQRSSLAQVVRILWAIWAIAIWAIPTRADFLSLTPIAEGEAQTVGGLS